MEKLIVILGPTASGKTTLAVKLASAYNGEIISADSRQIYVGMDIGTGKDLKEYKLKNKTIPYHLINILSPEKDYSVFQFKNDFHNIYDRINNAKKNTILCGGTALYLDSILFNYDMMGSPPNKILREKLEELPIETLIDKLIRLDESTYDINFHTTKRRVIRSIEILHSNNNKTKSSINKVIHNPLVIGIDVERELLLIKIKERLLYRLQNGMIEEVEKLISKGMTLERLKYFGLEYKFIGEYLFNNIDYHQMVNQLNTAINRFSKRQMTFFRRMEKRGVEINWIKLDSINNALNLTKEYFK